MAETATTTAPAADPKAAPVRPTRPDEKVFQTELAKAEKEHKASMERFVSSHRQLASRPHCFLDFR